MGSNLRSEDAGGVDGECGATNSNDITAAATHTTAAAAAAATAGARRVGVGGQKRAVGDGGLKGHDGVEQISMRH